MTPSRINLSNLGSPLNDHQLAALRQRRRVYIREREWWAEQQRAAGLLIRGGDAAAREFARFAADMVKQLQQAEKAVTWAIAYDQGQAPAYAPLDSASWRLLQMPDELADRIYQEYACGVYGIAND